MKKAALALSKTPNALRAKAQAAYRKAAGNYKVGFKAPTTIIAPVTKNTDKAVKQIQKTVTATAPAPTRPVIAVIPAKRTIIAATPKLTVKLAQQKINKSAAKQNKSAAEELALIQGELLAGGIEQEIAGGIGNM
jgi:hypothetical protein